MSTHQPKNRRPPTSVPTAVARRRTFNRSRSCDDLSTASGLTSDDLEAVSVCLCGVLDPLINHMESIGRLPGNNARVCVVCGVDTCNICKLCDKPMHFSALPKDSTMTVPCFYQYHNTCFYGLAKDDIKLMGVRKKDFKTPNDKYRKRHSFEMVQLHTQAIAKK